MDTVIVFIATYAIILTIGAIIVQRGLEKHIKTLKDLVAAQREEIAYWSVTAILMRERLRNNGLWEGEAKDENQLNG